MRLTLKVAFWDSRGAAGAFLMSIFSHDRFFARRGFFLLLSPSVFDEWLPEKHLVARFVLGMGLFGRASVLAR